MPAFRKGIIFIQVICIGWMANACQRQTPRQQRAILAGTPEATADEETTKTGSSNNSGNIDQIPGDGPSSQVTTPSGVETSTPVPSPTPTTLSLTEANVLDHLPAEELSIKAFCQRNGNDKIRKVFCATPRPEITSLKSLQAAIGLAFVNPTATGRGNNGKAGNPAFALSGHSSSLVVTSVSAINPRAIIFSPPTGAVDPNFVAMGFVRGEQFVELVANDPTTNVPAFFLVKFEQACNKTSPNKQCSYGELQTPAIESNWTSYSIYEDVDLINTILDCRQCHQPRGDGTPNLLRMQELQAPWTHFFRDRGAGGQALMADYTAAHGTEDYAGIPGALVTSSEPENLERFVGENGYGAQPNEFRSGTIELEVQQSGKSSTWQQLFDRSVNGEAIPPPFHGVKITDPAKLQLMTKAYQDFRAGTLPVGRFPDIRNVMKDADLWAIGLRPKPGLDGAGIIKQSCTQCHNSKLFQGVSRASFDADLTRISRQEKDLAIVRINLPESDLRVMPPRRFRTLSDAEKKLVEAELKK